MKKLLASILLATYLVSTCGIVINHHYCMNRLASTELFGAKKDKCGICGMHTDDSDGCCRDEARVLKVENDQQKAISLDLGIQSPVVLISFTSTYLILPFQNAGLSPHYFNHSPPLLSYQDTYLYNGVFRI